MVSSKIILCLDCLPVKGAARWLTLWDCYGGGVVCFLFSVGLRTSAKLLQSCPTLCNLMDCSLQSSSIHRIPHAGILEWIAMPSSRGIFLTQGLNPHLLHWQAGSLPPATWARVFADDARGWQCPFVLCLHPQGCLRRGVRA